MATIGAILQRLRRSARGRWLLFGASLAVIGPMFAIASVASWPFLLAAGAITVVTAALLTIPPPPGLPTVDADDPAEDTCEDAERRARAILSILESSLPILRTGLDRDSARRLAQVVYHELDFDAIAITDTERILAFEGAESEHHLPGDPVATEATRLVLAEARVALARGPEEVRCSHDGCRLASGVIAPLLVSDKPVGTIKFYRTHREALSKEDIDLAQGLSHLLSTHLELNEVEVQRQMATEAQMRALKAQIHPHFIFNVLNTISSACVVDPQVARTVVLRLSSLLRRTFRIRTEYITLQEELALVREYLEIESIRFPDMISYHEEVDSETMHCQVPVLILQPLVENCIIHGLAGGRIHIIVRARLRGGTLIVEVEDDGPGLSETELADLQDDSDSSREGVGIRNTRRRLLALAGDQGNLEVENRQPGLLLTMSMPARRNANSAGTRRELAHTDSPSR